MISGNCILVQFHNLSNAESDIWIFYDILHEFFSSICQRSRSCLPSTVDALIKSIRPNKCASNSGRKTSLWPKFPRKRWLHASTHGIVLWLATCNWGTSRAGFWKPQGIFPRRVRPLPFPFWFQQVRMRPTCYSKFDENWQFDQN